MICVNASILDECPSGLGIYTKNIIVNLHKKDSNITIFSPVDIEGVKVKKINKYVKTSYRKFGGLVRFLWTQLVLPFKVKRQDIIYHPFQYLSIFSRTKQIMTIHDLIPLYYPKLAKHQYIYYKYIMPILIKKAEKIICISNNTKNDILKFYHVNESCIEVVYNGYDDSLYNINNVNAERLQKYNINYKYMLMVGPSYEHKNMHNVIKAFSSIRDNTNCKLLIVGKESPYSKKLIELVKKYSLQQRVKFVGYVDIEDLPTIYGFSQCLIYPSLYEGFGFPVIEAMACEVQVLCSKASCLPEIGGDAAIYFNDNSEEGIKSSLLSYLNNNNIRKGKDKLDKNVSRFSWQKTSEKIYQLVKTINEGEK